MNGLLLTVNMAFHWIALNLTSYFSSHHVVEHILSRLQGGGAISGKYYVGQTLFIMLRAVMHSLE
jgi:hypothetical protein